ncbi:MAG TPA: DUF4962 domain-containing protein [Armatimonadota bacterium]|nr:DUF4962 domain-containing protein [Armatimonadota bacterium]
MSQIQIVCLLGCAVALSCARADQVRIGAESVVPMSPRSQYCRYINWRPADGEAVTLNPPRFSWPMNPGWPEDFGDGVHLYSFEISPNPDCSEPVVSVECAYNFYNTIPALDPARRWYWRVGYDIAGGGQWSAVRSFTIAPDSTVWDRSALAPERLRMPEHPRVLFNSGNLEQIRDLARTNEDSAAALAYLQQQADRAMARPWWSDFPQTDRSPEPPQAFYAIARDLALVAFTWRMTGDDRYAGVLERAVTWASYPPGGRSSPEGMGGDGSEDATQGNEYLALLFDWLYQDLTDEQRQVMIESLQWRVDHIMNRFSWRQRGTKGPMLRLTFRTSAQPVALEAEEMTLAGGARIATDERASGGRLVELAADGASVSAELDLAVGLYQVTVQGCGPAPDRDAFRIRLDDGGPQRVFINGWGECSATVKADGPGRHTLTIAADAGETGILVDRVQVAPYGDQRLWLDPTAQWREFTWQVPVPTGADRVTAEMFNYYAAGEVWWDSLGLAAPEGPELIANGNLATAAGELPAGWRPNQFGTSSALRYQPGGGRDGTGAAVISCPTPSDRGSWGQTLKLDGQRELVIAGAYRTSPEMLIAPLKAGGLSGMVTSHAYEASMDTAVCGLVLYEHSELGREWFEVILNYLIGVTVGHGFDEGWNEGAGYGTSKCKWLMNATMYFDTALPDAHLGLNPRYRVLGDWFCRIIPVGMDHHAWGNQANASRGNHLAHMREFAHLTGDGRFLLNWQQYGGKSFQTFRPWISYVLPACYPAPDPRPEDDPVALFPIEGWGMAATGPPSLASTYREGAGVIFQCRPRGGYSHSFNSDGSFQLHAYGQMLNHGGGSSANQDAYAYHTMSHNTILVDGLGQAQPSAGMLYPAYGRMVGFARGDDFVYFAGDATLCYPRQPASYSRWGLPMGGVYGQRALPYLERFVRHILFIRGRYFVICDDLRCSQPARYTWLYHIRPQQPFSFDAGSFTVNYTVGDVPVRLCQIYRPDALGLDDRQGLDGYVNPFTGEDYRGAKAEKWEPCGHNLWVTNAEPAEDWRFLAVIYPQPPGGEIPAITRIDDSTVRVGEDVICLDPSGPNAAGADFLVDLAAFRSPPPAQETEP